MNYAIRIRHALEETKELEGETTLTTDSAIEEELSKEFISPSRLESKTYFEDTKETEVNSQFYVLVEMVEKDKDNLEKLLYMLEEKLDHLSWYEIQLSVNHEDEGVKDSNSPWKVVRSKGTIPKEDIKK